MSAIPEILTIVQQILGDVQSAEQQATLNSILQAANAILKLNQQIVADLSDSTTGLAAIQADIATLSGQLGIDVTAILTAIGTPQQAGSPVTLPVTPPAGYGGLDSSATADAVWLASLTVAGGPVIARDAVGKSWLFAQNIGENVNQRYNFAPLFELEAPWDDDIGVGPLDYPDPNVNNIVVGDTALSFLTREAPLYTWTLTPSSNGYLEAPGLSGPFLWHFALNDADIAFVANGGGLTRADIPPVWPGLSDVVLGTTTALSDGLTITGPLDGVVVSITAVAPPMGNYPFGMIKSYVRAGAVLFVDDGGQAEFPQPLGPQDQVLTPRSMVSADSVVFRVTSGVVGTVTPFVRL